MEDPGNKVRLDYFEASDGPRLMLFGPLDVDLRSLQKLFRRLAATPGESVQLDGQPFVVSFHDTRVRLSCSGSMPERSARSRARFPGLRRAEGCSGPVFEWVRNPEGWDYLAELIDGLIESGTSGHQYMTRYPGEDAIVVASKGEYDDNVIHPEE